MSGLSDLTIVLQQTDWSAAWHRYVESRFAQTITLPEFYPMNPNKTEEMIRPVHCHFCREPMHYSDHPQHVPEIRMVVCDPSGHETALYAHVTCWNARQAPLRPMTVADAIKAGVLLPPAQPVTPVKITGMDSIKGFVQQARELAAQAWCTDKTRTFDMNSVLADAFADILAPRMASLENALNDVRALRQEATRLGQQNIRLAAEAESLRTNGNKTGAENIRLYAAFSRAHDEALVWQKSAKEFSGNADFYRGIIQNIGNYFGIRARTSDDGSVQDHVLALKVPELVAELHDTILAAENYLEHEHTGIPAGDLKGALRILTSRLRYKEEPDQGGRPLAQDEARFADNATAREAETALKLQAQLKRERSTPDAGVRGGQVAGPIKKNRILESMTKIDDGCFFIRIWALLPEGPATKAILTKAPYSAGVMQEWLRQRNSSAIRNTCWTEEAQKILRVIGSMDGVNAVEVCDHDGQGLILYPDWS